MDDITIVKTVHCKKQLHTGRAYYYQGNFYYPLDMLNNKEMHRVMKAIRKWYYKNKDMVLADRAKPDFVDSIAMF